MAEPTPPPEHVHLPLDLQADVHRLANMLQTSLFAFKIELERLANEGAPEVVTTRLEGLLSDWTAACAVYRAICQRLGARS